MSDRSSPAKMARGAMAAVQEGQRDAWLDHFAEDARVEDPVGHFPPIEGREGLAQFWDQVIATLTSTRFEVSRTWETADEALLLATVTVVATEGAGTSYDGAFNYRLGEDGLISSLRAFWDLPAVAAALSA